eukprot:CAMPEP_0174257452 /NCGR_PEP_ID=MMETSP0439-20130205/6583_1 /TAXON_ID=0 /ORGANISM="Stereomyxa ramosa, Strain Chinc5" /LENGTH=579 /DNA_ID=CAMNT_0015340543 /DNA_START=59 /DNA_END=1795 /DNA_ORIENTATION=+
MLLVLSFVFSLLFVPCHFSHKLELLTSNLQKHLPTYFTYSYTGTIKQSAQQNGIFSTAPLIDSNGDLLFAGMFKGKLEFQHANGSVSTIQTTDYCVYVLKFSLPSFEIAWVTQFQNIVNGRSYASSIALDAEDNLILGGTYVSSIKIGPFRLYGGKFDTNIFWVKYSSNGQIAWVQNAIGSSVSICSAVAVNQQTNEVFSVGYFVKSLTFDRVINSDYLNYFLAKFTETGAVEWVHAGNVSTIHSATTTGSSFAYGLSIDKQGNPSIIGTFSGVLTFHTATGFINFTNPGTNLDIFVTKYNGSHPRHILWASVIGADTSVCGNEHNLISVDDLTFITGCYSAGTLHFASNRSSLNCTSGNCLYTASYSPSGELEWAQNVGGYNSQYALGLTNYNNSIFVTSYFERFANFTSFNTDDYIEVYLSKGAFVAKYNLSGTLQWVTPLNGAIDIGGIVFDKMGNMIGVGTFRGNIQLGDEFVHSINDSIYVFNMTSQAVSVKKNKIGWWSDPLLWIFACLSIAAFFVLVLLVFFGLISLAQFLYRKREASREFIKGYSTLGYEGSRTRSDSDYRGYVSFGSLTL